MPGIYISWENQRYILGLLRGPFMGLVTLVLGFQKVDYAGVA